MNELTQKIEQWAFDRNLQTADPIKQFDKLVEEYGELVQGLNKNNIELIKDSIGDMYVVLVVMFTQLNRELPPENQSVIPTDTVDYMVILTEIGKALTDNNTLLVRVSVANLLQMLELTCVNKKIDFKECVQLAYEEIRHRKGRMINGVFVKESDLKSNKETPEEKEADLKETPEDSLQSKNKETRNPNKYID